ncbi:hypothetical protein ACW73L_01075 [Methylolobus aquaticus]|uniref:hypothetical protein n=1 Tax=Methylotetracoccus oryzae TaxID=1919059 RepID=UPI0011188ADD|nr:hypothetical protein [Methylotetracoccus oryzae]
MKKWSIVALALASLGAGNVLFAADAEPVRRESAEDVQIDVLIATAKTKADHLKIAAMYSDEAKAESAKAQQLRNQALAYKEHKHDVYGRDPNLLDLIEHADAASRSYQEAADRHVYLAHIHEQIAAGLKR